MKSLLPGRTPYSKGGEAGEMPCSRAKVASGGEIDEAPHLGAKRARRRV